MFVAKNEIIFLRKDLVWKKVFLIRVIRAKEEDLPEYSGDEVISFVIFNSEISKRILVKYAKIKS